MSNLSQFAGGSSIKSIQRGVITLSSVTSATATITAVVTAKTALRHLGATSDVGEAYSLARINLTNTTTITATRGNATGTSTVSWELTEYN